MSICLRKTNSEGSTVEYPKNLKINYPTSYPDFFQKNCIKCKETLQGCKTCRSSSRCDLCEDPKADLKDGKCIPAKKEGGGGFGLLVIILLLIAGGVGAAYYFLKVKKGNSKEEASLVSGDYEKIQSN